MEAGAVEQPEPRRTSFGQAAAEQAAAEQAAAEQAAAEQAAAEEAAEEAAASHAALVGGYEPTMTLNTRDAFAAINQMFGVS